MGKKNLYLQNVWMILKSQVFMCLSIPVVQWDWPRQGGRAVLAGGRWCWPRGPSWLRSGPEGTTSVLRPGSWEEHEHGGHQRPPAQHILIRGHLQQVGGETVSGDQPRNLAWIHQYTAAKSSHSPCYNLLGIELFAAYEHVECLHFTFSQHFTTSTFQGEVISAAVSARV